jgi:enoyl-CoA hydratase
MLAMVSTAVEGCLAEPAARAIVIACASAPGAEAEAEMDALDATAYALSGQEALHAVESSPLPVIAAISGACLDASLELALACDLRVAAQDATFAFTQAFRGVCSGFGGMARLARLVGPGAAKLICLEGRPISAAEALRLGLVERVVAAGEHLQGAAALASRVAAASPRVVAAAKEAIDGGLMLPLSDALRLEAAICGGVAADETARAWRRANRANRAAGSPAD